MFSKIDNINIKGPSFDDPNVSVIYDVSDDTIKQFEYHARRQPLLDFWTLVKGEKPPVNNIGYHENFREINLKGLMGATALFKGIERPYAENNNGDEIYIFICRFEYMYKLIPDIVCIAKYDKSPENAVFACYVRRYPTVTADQKYGMILNWEWVQASQEDPNLPKDWESRYESRVWRR